MNHEHIKTHYCTIDEAAEILNVDQQDILAMIRSGDLQECKLKHCSDRLIPRVCVESRNGGIDIKT